MILPEIIRNKLDSLLLEIGGNKLKLIREELTEKYKLRSGTGESLINSENDAIVYALCRMPATYGVLYSLVSELIFEEKINNISSLTDIGSGTGAGYFVFKELFDNLQFRLYDREKNMREVLVKLSDGEVKPENLDIVLSKPSEKSDFVLCSYVLSELSENMRMKAFENLLLCSNKYVLVVDTGTPKVYEEYLKLKPFAEALGFRVKAPCMCDVCPLENDYCQFYARVERSAALRQSKSASQTYEDEKYFYLLFEKCDNKTVQKNIDCKSRVIRRPVIKTNMCELVLCTTNGVKKQVFTKKNKEQYKKAKKTKINELIKGNKGIYD